MIRRLAATTIVALALVAGVVVPNVNAALPTNSWLGLKYFTSIVTGTQATCHLGAATGTDSVWVAITGSASLDILQVGAKQTPAGPRYFYTYARGEPNAPGSMYVETSLGTATTGNHAYRVRLNSGNWDFMIDGLVRASVPSIAFKTWPTVASQVQNEVEQIEPMGGTLLAPTGCSAAKYQVPAGLLNSGWSFQGSGPSAGSAITSQGLDWFNVRHP